MRLVFAWDVIPDPTCHEEVDSSCVPEREVCTRISPVSHEKREINFDLFDA
jgi:hypothetical protein